MIIWVDAQLPSAVSVWITQNFNVRAAEREIDLKDGGDLQIFR